MMTVAISVMMMVLWISVWSWPDDANEKRLVVMP